MAPHTPAPARLRPSLLLALGFLLLAPGLTAFAQVRTLPGASDRSVNLTVTAILATREARAADPALRELQPLLERALPGYLGFSLLSSNRWVAAKDRQEQLSLPNGDELRLTYRGLDGALIRLDLAIPPRLTTSVRVAEHGTFFQAGLPHESGILVLAISASRVANVVPAAVRPLPAPVRPTLPGPRPEPPPLLPRPAAIVR